MGGEKFDTPQPESYLFGENADLNFLGSRPTAVSIHRKSYNQISKKTKIECLELCDSFPIRHHKPMSQQKR